MPQSIQITETSPLLHDANCVYCHVDLDLGDHAVVCDSCHSPHHTECWQANYNSCSTFGCNKTDVAILHTAVEVKSTSATKSAAKTTNGLTGLEVINVIIGAFVSLVIFLWVHETLVISMNVWLGLILIAGSLIFGMRLLPFFGITDPQSQTTSKGSSYLLQQHAFETVPFGIGVIITVLLTAIIDEHILTTERTSIIPTLVVFLPIFLLMHKVLIKPTRNFLMRTFFDQD